MACDARIEEVEMKSLAARFCERGQDVCVDTLRARKSERLNELVALSRLRTNWPFPEAGYSVKILPADDTEPSAKATDGLGRRGTDEGTHQSGRTRHAPPGSG